MQIVNNIELFNLKGVPIHYDIYYQPTQYQQPIAIFSHGYKGFKDWGAWDLVAKSFAERGVIFVKLNFSHNGVSKENGTEFTELDLFAENNYSLELSDLQLVLDNIGDNCAIKKFGDIHNIHLIGHSRGGAISILTAINNPHIKKLITWASIDDMARLFPKSEAAIQDWERTGVMYVENARTKQQLPLNYQFYKDYQQNIHRYKLSLMAPKVNIPTLLIHGDKDANVPLSCGVNLNQWIPKSRLSIIEDGNHVFGMSHPYNEDVLPLPMQQVVHQSIDFVLEMSMSELNVS